MTALCKAADQSVADKSVAVRTVIGEQIGTVGDEDGEGTREAHSRPPATLGCKARSRRNTSFDKNNRSARRGRSPGRGRPRKREELASTKTNRAHVESSSESAAPYMPNRGTMTSISGTVSSSPIA